MSELVSQLACYGVRFRYVATVIKMLTSKLYYFTCVDINCTHTTQVLVHQFNNRVCKLKHHLKQHAKLVAIKRRCNLTLESRFNSDLYQLTKVGNVFTHVRLHNKTKTAQTGSIPDSQLFLCQVQVYAPQHICVYVYSCFHVSQAPTDISLFIGVTESTKTLFTFGVSGDQITSGQR